MIMINYNTQVIILFKVTHLNAYFRKLKANGSFILYTYLVEEIMYKKKVEVLKGMYKFYKPLFLYSIENSEGKTHTNKTEQCVI